MSLLMRRHPALAANCRFKILAKNLVDIVYSLEHGGSRAKEKAARQLAGLCAEGAQTMQCVTDAGAIPPLIALLRTGTEQGKECATCALGNLSTVDANSTIIEDAGGIPLFIALLSKENDRGKDSKTTELAAGALGNLAARECAVSIADAGGVPPLIALLTIGTDNEKEHAAHALANLASTDATALAIAESDGILLALLTNGSDKVRQHATDVLLNIVRAKLAHMDNQHHTTVGRANIILPLVAVLKHGPGAKKGKAAGTLWGLAYNAENSAAIVDTGAISPLVALSKKGSEHDREIAAGALHALSRQLSRNNHATPVDDVSDVNEVNEVSVASVASEVNKVNVVNKVNRVIEVNKANEVNEINKCSLCGVGNLHLQKCSRCLKARYCSATCQKNHWKHHRASCKK